MPCSASAPLRARVAAAAVVVAMAAGAAASPLRALPKRVVVPRDGNVSVNLEAEVPIPRGGEISWPLMVPAGVGTVQRVEVILRNLAHDNVSALEASLSHADQEAVLFRGGDGGLPRGYAAGDPARLLTAQRAGEGFAAPSPFRGAGHDFRFTDRACLLPFPPSPRAASSSSGGSPARAAPLTADWSAINAALGRPARQSSTQFEGVASRAVDGDVDGRYESESVTHTGGHGASDSHPWWQVDLGNQTAVAAIKVWSRVQAPTVDTVQVVAVVADGPLRSGSFRLNASYNAIAGATAPIGVNASAEEVKQALEALPHLGTVQVGREAVPRPGAPRRSAWTITFVSEPGRVEPMAALDVNIPAVGARVDVRVARNGSDNVWYNYRGEVRRAPHSAIGRALWLLTRESAGVSHLGQPHAGVGHAAAVGPWEQHAGRRNGPCRLAGAPVVRPAAVGGGSTGPSLPLTHPPPRPLPLLAALRSGSTRWCSPRTPRAASSACRAATTTTSPSPKCRC